MSTFILECFSFYIFNVNVWIEKLIKCYYISLGQNEHDDGLLLWRGWSEGELVRVKHTFIGQHIIILIDSWKYV